jgi:adenosylcobinamide kinase/adenosylcobinamide-phosphate guanylyltransferase
MAYRKVLGEINQKIAEISDEVIEVVAGIPIVMKKKRNLQEAR